MICEGAISALYVIHGGGRGGGRRGGSDLGGVFSKEGVPRRLLIIVAAKLLIDSQYDVCLQPANSMPFGAVQSLFLTLKQNLPI